jgi:WD40-like Beta Propeller Repeat
MGGGLGWHRPASTAARAGVRRGIGQRLWRKLDSVGKVLPVSPVPVRGGKPLGHPREPDLVAGIRRRPVQIYSASLAFPALAPSADGKRVFFAGGQERRELVRYDARRSQFMAYLSGVAGRWIDYSPDERWVAYTTAADGALWRSRPDGSERIRLMPAPFRAGKPRWSPDGTRITACGYWAGEPLKLYVIDARGSGGVPAAITAALYADSEPAWSPDGNALLFSGGDPRASELYVMDLQTRKADLLPGSEALSRAAWSPDPRYIAATGSDGLRILLFDFHTRRWTPLATGFGLGPPFWSRDGKYVYYQDAFAGAEQPVFRVRVADRRIEPIVSSRQLLQSNATGYVLCGLAPGDAPVASVIRSNSDLSALDLDLP